ncbi:MAG: lytic transglycosylase domain-containing protein [Pseudomonadales bacterium]|nr:lytic transglycosylase domain-containing protein [Pseudomonadales bacterium]
MLKLTYLNALVMLGCISLYSLQIHAVETPDIELLEKLASSMSKEIEHEDRFDAQVWLISTESRLKKYVSNQQERLLILHTTYREAHKQDLDPDLVLSLMQVESAFDRFAVSKVGAQGLMQIMPFWQQEIGRPQDNLTMIETNIRYGTTILAHYIEVSNTDLVEALARYNGSKGRLKYPEKVVKAWRNSWQTRATEELPELQNSCIKYGLKACGALRR